MITSAVEERTQLPMCQRRGKFLLRWPVRIKTTQAQRVGPHVGGGPHVAAVVQVACSCTHVAGPYCTTRSCDRNVACCDVSGVRWLCDIMSSCCSLSLLVGVRETWIAGARRASGAACALLGRRRRPQMAAACCPEVYLAWATDVRLRGNGCAGSSFESQHNWLWATGRFAAF